MIDFESTEIIEEILLSIRIGVTDNMELLFKDHLFHPIDASNATLLHYAAEHGNEQVTQYLVDHGCVVDAQDSSGTTPLMVAIRKIRRDKIMEILLAAGANILVLNSENKNALQMSCDEHRLSPTDRELILQQLPKMFSTSEKIAQTLIEAGCHLYQAAYLGNAKVLECMLKQNHDIENMHPGSKQTALHVAYSLDDVDSVKLLLKYGANLHALDSRQANCFYYLYLYERDHNSEKIELLSILLDQKVSAMTCTQSDEQFQITPTLVYGNATAIQMIMQESIDFTVKDKANGRSLLHHLGCNLNPGVVEVLKSHENKFDFNVVDDSGMNCLYVAMKFANIAMVEFLLSRGVDPNCAHKIYGHTALYCAFSNFQSNIEHAAQCIELILQHNASAQFVVNTKNNEILTVVDIAQKNKKLMNLKPVLAHLAILEKRGEPICQLIVDKLKSLQWLENYYNGCKKLLKKKICESVTLYDLLIANEKKMALYAGNKRLVKKLIRLRYKQNLKSSQSYFYNSLEKKISLGIKRRKLMNEAAIILSNISKGRFDKTNLVICKIIKYLSIQNMELMYNSSKSNLTVV